MKKYVTPEATLVELRLEEGIADSTTCYKASCEDYWEAPSGS
jgi:hypothetical protein